MSVRLSTIYVKPRSTVQIAASHWQHVIDICHISTILQELWLVCVSVSVFVFYGCLRAIVNTLQLRMMCICVKLQR